MGGTTAIHIVRCSGFGGSARRLEMLPIAQPNAPKTTSRKGHQAAGAAAGYANEQQAGHCNRDADHATRRELLPQEDRAEQHREGCRHLQHKRRESGREACRHAEVQPHEL